LALEQRGGLFRINHPVTEVEHLVSSGQPDPYDFYTPLSFIFCLMFKEEVSGADKEADS
jgi:hypothetical protein